MSSNLETGGHGEGASPPSRPYWIGVGLMAFGALWLHGGLSLPVGARYAAVGPGLMPTVIGAGLLLLGANLVFQIWRGETFEPQDSEDAAANAPMDRRAFFTALAAVLLPIVTMRTLGLPLTAALSFTLVALALGSRRIVLNLLVGLVIGTLSWLLFACLGLQLGGALPFFGI